MITRMKKTNKLFNGYYSNPTGFKNDNSNAKNCGGR